MASNDVVKLEFPEHVRRRYGMYIGDATNPNVILREVVDNSVDELYDSPSADTIWIDRLEGFYVVADNGRGIPVKESKVTGVTMTRLAMENLGSGSKFNKKTFNIGMNGVGAACTNALSDVFIVLSKMSLHDFNTIPKQLQIPLARKDNVYYYVRYEKGILKEEGFKFLNELEVKATCYKNYPSTITIFKPDATIFKRTLSASVPSSLMYVKYILGMLGKKSNIIVNGKEYEEVIKSLGMDMKVVVKSEEDKPENPEVTFLISVGFQEKRFDNPEISGSVNGLICNQGVHIKMAKEGFSRAYTSLFSNCSGFELNGLDFMIIALCNEPNFSSQTKERLSEIPGINVRGQKEFETLATEFRKLMNKYYQQFKLHHKKVLEYLKSLDKLDKINLIKATVTIAAENSRSESITPNSLKDCSTSDRQKASLFVVEGKSAGGNLISVRNPEIHAVLGLTISSSKIW